MDAPRDETTGEPEPETHITDQEGLPRWVKVFVAIAVAFVVLLVAAKLAGLGDPGRGHERAASAVAWS